MNTELLPGKEAIVKTAIYLFAVPWIVMGIQHYMYAGFVATLVPSFIGGKLFWVYLTGTAMIAAGISFISNIKIPLAATMLALMLMIFILLIHVPILSGHPLLINWTRVFQDIALLGTAFMVTGNIKLINTGRVLYAGCVAVLGFQHLMHVSFITAKIPPYFPLINLWDSVIGILMICAAVCIILKYRPLPAGLSLGVIIVLFALLYNLPLLISDVHNGQQWTGLMLDLALAAGAFISIRNPIAMRYAH